MDQPKESVPRAPAHTDSPAIRALADHFKLTTEEIHAWLRQENGIPVEVVVSWIAFWHRGRRPKTRAP